MCHGGQQVQGQTAHACVCVCLCVCVFVRAFRQPEACYPLLAGCKLGFGERFLSPLKFTARHAMIPRAALSTRGKHSTQAAPPGTAVHSPQVLRIQLGSLLARVGPQHLFQCRLQQVGGCVVGTHTPPQLWVHIRRHLPSSVRRRQHFVIFPTLTAPYTICKIASIKLHSCLAHHSAPTYHQRITP